MGALDWFRLIAAFLVTAIHISPLEDLSIWGDLTLTRIVGRVAVPFFFMVTGYFVLAGSKEDRIRRSLIKNLKWYLLAIIIYLPINWYAGNLSGLTVSSVLKELLIQGTFYHLWYLPALLTGLLLCWGLKRLLGTRDALIVSALLYMVGLMGDSYYGLATQIPVLKTFYDGMFAVTENTRNGFFLAPIFLMMGAYFGESAGQAEGKKARRFAPQKDFLFWGLGLAFSLAAMTAEGLYVHLAGWPHHDSMYLLLPVTMTFLFGSLIRLPARERPMFRSISLWIYLLHPFFIVVVRAFARVTRTTDILVDNNLIHYICVALASAVTAYLLALFTRLWSQRRRAARQKKQPGPLNRNGEPMELDDLDETGVMDAGDPDTGNLDMYNPAVDGLEIGDLDADDLERDESDMEDRNRDGSNGDESGADSRAAGLRDLTGNAIRAQERRSGTEMAQGKRAWIEVSKDALAVNIAQFRQLLSEGCRIMAVVKADAYGHGAMPVSLFLEKLGITDFAVATADEGAQLRRGGVSGQILILGYTDPAQWDEVRRYDLIQAVVDEEYAVQMSRYGCENGALRAHLAVDTGMHRLGIDAGDIRAVQRILHLPGIQIEGIFSHMSVADSRQPDNVEYTADQIRRFDGLKKWLEENRARAKEPELVYHLQNSYGFLNYPQLRYDFVRLGIVLYGVCSSGEDVPQINPGLEPVMSVRARVAMVRGMEAGQELGYGRAFHVEKDGRMAVVTIGYADGIPRSYGQGGAQVLIRGRRYPVVGLVCMDQLLVDISADTDETIVSGDVATLIGRDGGEYISAEESAAWCGTITNELLCRMGARLERIQL